MGRPYKNIEKYLPEYELGVFIEIGSDRLEGSTEFLAKLAQSRNTVLHSVDIQIEPQSRIQHPSIYWHVECGSVWAKTTWPLISQPISVVYLDNYDYQYQNVSDDTHFIWNEKTYHDIKGPYWPDQFVKFVDLPAQFQKECKEVLNLPVDFLSTSMHDLYINKGFKYTNAECQLEHLGQLIALMPWVTQNTLIVFDDTFIDSATGCWAGKNGPGVVYLLAQNFTILEIEGSSLIMKKNGIQI
jgi:hypothetical protein